MPIFGRSRDGDAQARTAADRESARLERERRRAEREGRARPDEPAAAEDPPAPVEPAEDPPAAVEPVADPPEWELPPGDAPRAARGPGATDPPPAAAPAPDPADRVAGREPDREAASPEADPDPEPEPEPHVDAAGETEPAADDPTAAVPIQAAAAPAQPQGAPDWSPADRNGDGDAASAAGDGRPTVPRPAEDPQATQPFAPVTPAASGRRTVSLPRPQTDLGEHTDGWDAPIGTVRRTRGGGGYQAQPGASGYPPYRKLGVNRPRRRWLRRIVALLALGLAIAAVAFAYLLFQPMHGSGHGRVAVVVPAGATAGQIGDLLAARGVVRSSFLFSLRARLSGQREKLRSGRYSLRRDMPYGAALAALTTPPKAAPVVQITVPEGPSRREEAPKLRRAGLRGSYLRATRRSSRLRPRDYGAPRGTNTLEGFLYPATYELRKSDATASRLVAKQLDAFKSAFAKVNTRTARRRNLSRYDVLIIASMIEREALVPRDRRLISAVIYNRLRQHIPIGIDATLRYALNQWSRPLRVSELNSRSAFNTRRRQGLPPTPIGNPGLPALRAAANPAKVPYLFYVVKPCGNGAHAFSSTDAQFQRDVARYNRARARRGGKDPSRC